MITARAAVRSIRRKAEALNIKYIDLLADIANAGAQKSLYKPSDSHFNIEGNELVARMIAEKLFLNGTRALDRLGGGSLITIGR